ncbi:hypothetical protein E2C01_037434 [Portunus trituberculatus]|uniref:Uncharacterized protein n=1 Tax=Portunus trituberculatus TaxID=210409 RepID=A0A5B7F9C6_PORTR|nr:hypothetical protein [Portunus trituberculatus]
MRVDAGWQDLQQGKRMDQSTTSISRLDSTGAESDRLDSSDDALPDDEDIRCDSNQIPSCLIKVNVTNSALEDECGGRGDGFESLLCFGEVLTIPRQVNQELAENLRYFHVAEASCTTLGEKKYETQRAAPQQDAAAPDDGISHARQESKQIEYRTTNAIPVTFFFNRGSSRLRTSPTRP